MICVAMERNRDLRRVNGLRKRQRVTIQRDFTDDEGRLELQETVSFRDLKRLKNGRDREVIKRRRFDRSTLQQRSGGDGSADSSDEEYCVKEDGVRFHQRNRFPSPSFFSAVNTRRGFRDLTPELTIGGDEILGFLVPRRTRSATVRKVNDSLDSRSGGFREELGQSKASEEASPASIVGSSRKKTKSSEAKTGFWSSSSDSTAPADIEIEAAEALFDLMKQSHSQPRIRAEPQKNDKHNGICDTHDELKTLKADGKDKNNFFSDEDEPSLKMKAEEMVIDSMAEKKKEVGVVKDQSHDQRAEELVRGDEREVGSLQESEMVSYVKANALDIRDPTATNANHRTDSETKKITKLQIDLMASPPLPSSPERDVSIEIDHLIVKKDVEMMRKKGPGVQERLVRDDFKYILPNFSSGVTNNGNGVLPRGGYIPQLQAVNQMESSPISMKFKLSHPRPKRCVFHQCIATNIQQHQQLMKSKASVSISNAPCVNVPPNNQAPVNNPLYGSKKLPPSSSGATMSMPFYGGACPFSDAVFPPTSPFIASLQNIAIPSFNVGSSTVPLFDHPFVYAPNQKLDKQQQQLGDLASLTANPCNSQAGSFLFQAMNAKFGLPFGPTSQNPSIFPAVGSNQQQQQQQYEEIEGSSGCRGNVISILSSCTSSTRRN